MVRRVLALRFLFTVVMKERKKNLGFSSSEFGETAVRKITF